MITEIIPDALDDQRVDRVVALLSGCSRAEAAKLVADGRVRLDDRVVATRSTRVRSGASISFELPPTAAALPEPDPAIELNVVWSDDDLAVVNKPAGLVVHPGAGQPDGTLVNGALALWPDIAGVGDPQRPGIVHRLDATTSGLMMVARSVDAYEELVGALAARTVTREYDAVVHGVVADDRGVVDAPIGRSTRRRTRMAVSAEGREARTHYRVVARRNESPQATRLRLRLETGRTHQIRVHLSAIGHPVVGDTGYGAPREGLVLERVALHATALALTHPTTGEALHFSAEPPADLAALHTRCGFRDDVDAARVEDEIETGETPGGLSS